MHKSVRHKSILPGIDAISIKSDRTFPRHSHDEFGLGYIVEGAQDSWSGRGLVEAVAGDTITVNPSELHDGIGLSGNPRHWRMLFLSPAAVEDFCDEPQGRTRFCLPVNRSQSALKLAVKAFAAVALDRSNVDHAEQLVMLALGAQFEPEADRDPVGCSKCSAAVQTV